MFVQMQEGEVLNLALTGSPAVFVIDYAGREPGRFTITSDQEDVQGRSGLVFDLGLDEVSAGESELLAAISSSQDEDPGVIASVNTLHSPSLIEQDQELDEISDDLMMARNLDEVRAAHERLTNYLIERDSG